MKAFNPRAVTEAESRAVARAYLLYPTQGKCEPCGRFYFFRGRLKDRTCPTCRQQLSRTSWESTLPRFIIRDRRVEIVREPNPVMLTVWYFGHRMRGDV